MEVQHEVKNIGVPAALSKQVLTIGTQYENHRGGIGAVIEIYSHYFENFQYIKSHKTGTLFLRSWQFLECIVVLFAKLATKKEIKIVHLHGASFGSFFRKYICFVIAKGIFNRKVIYHVHGGKFHEFYGKSNFFLKKLIKNLLARADCVLCLSESWKLFFENNFKLKRIEILPNIIEYPAPNGSLKKREEIYLLFLGLINREKGIFDLLHVLSEKRHKYIGKIKLVIGGCGEEEKLKRVIAEHQLTAMVEFAGWVSKWEKAGYLQRTDIYILPSYIEGLPISILEAMSYGKPIISTKIGGIPEIVKTGENGILFEPGNLSELEAAIDFFLDNPKKIQSYGQISELVVEKYLPKAVLKKLVHIYNSQNG